MSKKKKNGPWQKESERRQMMGERLLILDPKVMVHLAAQVRLKLADKHLSLGDREAYEKLLKKAEEAAAKLEAEPALCDELSREVGKHGAGLN